MSCGTGVLLCELDAHICKWPSVTLLGSKNLLDCRSDLSGRGNPGPPKRQASLLHSVDQLCLLGTLASLEITGFYEAIHLRTIMGSPSFEVPSTLRLFCCWVNQPCSLPHLLLRCCCSLRAQLHWWFPACLLVLGTRGEGGLGDISHEVGECLSKLGTAFGLCLCDGNSVGNEMWRDMEIQTSCLILS